MGCEKLLRKKTVHEVGMYEITVSLTQVEKRKQERLSHRVK